MELTYFLIGSQRKTRVFTAVSHPKATEPRSIFLSYVSFPSYYLCGIFYFLYIYSFHLSLYLLPPPLLLPWFLQCNSPKGNLYFGRRKKSIKIWWCWCCDPLNHFTSSPLSPERLVQCILILGRERLFTHFGGYNDQMPCNPEIVVH